MGSKIIKKQSVGMPPLLIIRCRQRPSDPHIFPLDPYVCMYVCSTYYYDVLRVFRVLRPLVVGLSLDLDTLDFSPFHHLLGSGLRRVIH
jgi:hypothetical protein